MTSGMAVQKQAVPVSIGGQSAGDASVACEGKPLTTANGISLAGYALGLWWLGGGPSWAAIASIAADELDGRVARSMGDASCLGGNLDWAIDLTFTGLVAWRLGALWMLPAITAAQAYLRSQRTEPPLMSARGYMMIGALIKEGLAKGKSK